MVGTSAVATATKWWALSENGGGGGAKMTELLHIKTDILWLQIMRYLKIFLFVLEKREV